MKSAEPTMNSEAIAALRLTGRAVIMQSALPMTADLQTTFTKVID
jgi:hypothetical protein